MAGISKLPEELRLEILGWLGWDHDTLFSLYNTSTTFRASVVASVISARKGHAEAVEIILTLDTIHLMGDALREAANEGHADVVSVMLKKLLGQHSSGFHDALSEAIRRGHTEVIKEFRKYHD
jgi:hypothetical protein